MTDEVRVIKTRIIGTQVDVYNAWTPTVICTGHLSVRRIDGTPGWWGRLGSEGVLPPDIEALPFGDERIEKVRAWHEAHYARAYDLIVAAHPEAAGGLRSMGSISVTIDAGGTR